MGCYFSKENSKDLYIKNEINNYMNDFINKHCELGPQHFIPLAILKNAWLSYRRNNESLDKMIEELDSKCITIFSSEIYPNISYDANNRLYYGITLKTWP